MIHVDNDKWCPVMAVAAVVVYDGCDHGCRW